MAAATRCATATWCLDHIALNFGTSTSIACLNFHASMNCAFITMDRAGIIYGPLP
ncbi:hypothetical protein BDV19DRAFT_370400 [Aspergillus venezuelensis]